MRWPSRPEIGIYLICAAVIVAIGWRSLAHDKAGGAAGAAPGLPTARVSVRQPATSAVVHIVGAVQRPGVYTLREGQRVRDAVRRAGGATDAADLAALNLAARVSDAQQVVVPERTVPGDAGPQGVVAATTAPISLTQATVEQLDTLDGVGPATARKILEYRQQHGGFRSLDELSEVAGIGPKKLEALRAQLQP